MIPLKKVLLECFDTYFTSNNSQSSNREILKSLKDAKIGIVGTGMMARGLAYLLNSKGIKVSSVLTRRKIETITDFPLQGVLTNDLPKHIDACDLLVECSGDPIHATEVVELAFKANLPVVTLNAEFQVTTGSYFVDKGLITESEGDQPGSIAALNRDALDMGFDVKVFGNIKGFLNLDPTIEEMRYWAEKQGLTVNQTTSFTDGTKVQIEQTLVANGLGAEIYKPGFVAPRSNKMMDGASVLCRLADKMKASVSDFIVCPGNPGVFVAGTHDKYQEKYLEYLKMGKGPYYTLVRPFHLCHLEMVKSIRGLYENRDVLLNNGINPKYSVAAICKRDMEAGSYLAQGIGGFDVRGSSVAIKDNLDHVPIGLIQKATLKRKVERGQQIEWDDLDIPDSRAKEIWFEIIGAAKKNALAT